jgi:hypothetical protein
VSLPVAPNLDGRTFRVAGERTVLIFSQVGAIVWAAYAGGDISHGHFLGLMDAAGNLDARYHHVTVDGDLQSGAARFLFVRETQGLAYSGIWRMEEFV